MTSECVLIQRNPKSGRGARRGDLLDLIRALRTRGFFVRSFKNRDRLDKWIETCRDTRRIRCLVAAGGDGTAADLVNRHPGMPIAPFPLGTENLISKYFGITRSGPSTASMIADGQTHSIDIGRANGRRFLLMAGVGIDGEVVHRVDSQRTGPIQRSTYFKPILQTVWNYRYPKLTVRIDGQAETFEGSQVVAVNINRYAMGFQFGPGAIDDDGLLEISIFRTGSVLATARYMWHIRRGTHARLPDVTTLRGRSLTIESSEPVPVQIDGDPAEFTPVKLELEQRAQPFVVPAAFHDQAASTD